jgi:hypothetical protein
MERLQNLKMIDCHVVVVLLLPLRSPSVWWLNFYVGPKRWCPIFAGWSRSLRNHLLHRKLAGWHRKACSRGGHRWREKSGRHAGTRRQNRRTHSAHRWHHEWARLSFRNDFLCQFHVLSNNYHYSAHPHRCHRRGNGRGWHNHALCGERLSGRVDQLLSLFLHPGLVIVTNILL